MPGPEVSVLLRQLRTIIAEQKAEGQTDQRLLDRFLSERDEAAFAALLVRHGPMVLGVCRRILHDEHLAEDVFQATFLVLARKAETIRKRPSVGSWLHGVALRLARIAISESKRSKKPDVRNPSQAAVDPHAEATWHEAQEILDDELQRLPEKYRLPLILCYLEGLTRDEAAAQLGWTATKLKGLLERGRDRLRSRLIRRGVTLSATGAATLLTDTLLSASVPPLLAVSTIQAAVRFATGANLAACGISASVVALTEAGLRILAPKAMTLILVLAVILVAIGTSVAFNPPSNPGPERKPLIRDLDEARPAIAGLITVKLKERTEGEKILVTINPIRNDRLTTVDDFGRIGEQRVNRTASMEFEETILKKEPGKWATKLLRTYTKAEVKVNGTVEDVRLRGKTVLLEFKDGTNRFTDNDGTTIDGPAAKALAEDSTQESEEEIRKAYLPTSPVAVGASWKIDLAQVAKTMSASALVVNADNAIGEGTLVRTYQKDGRQYGEMHFTMEMPVKTIGQGKAQYKFMDDAKITYKGTFDGCIDGTSFAATLTTKRTITGQATSEHLPDAVATLDLTTEATRILSDPPKK